MLHMYVNLRIVVCRFVCAYQEIRNSVDTYGGAVRPAISTELLVCAGNRSALPVSWYQVLQSRYKGVPRTPE